MISPMDSMDRTKVFFIVLAIFVGLAVWGGVETASRQSFGTYRPIPATVLSSEIERSGGGRRSRRTYRLYVAFEFDAPNGKAVSKRWSTMSDHYRIPDGFNERSRADEMKATWFPGRQFTAYQSTSNPMSVVAMNPSEGAAVFAAFLGFGLAGAIGTVLVMIFLLPKRSSMG